MPSRTLPRRVLVFAAGIVSCGPSSNGPPASIEIGRAASAASAGPTPDPPAPSAKVAPTGSCKARCVPGTDVEDTAENRRVLAFCERYRKGLVDKDIPALLALASPDYRDGGGTPDPDDDIDFAGLRSFFETTLGRIDKIRVEMRYTNVREQNDGVVVVEFTMATSYTFAAAPGAWQDQPPRQGRLALERDARSFKILRGM
jgi:hypothetical protein